MAILSGAIAGEIGRAARAGPLRYQRGVADLAPGVGWIQHRGEGDGQGRRPPRPPPGAVNAERIDQW